MEPNPLAQKEELNSKRAMFEEKKACPAGFFEAIN
jgi:hypothetical protein